MCALTKIWKTYLGIAQFSFGLLGGAFYYLICFLSLAFKPMKKLLRIYRDGAPIYSSFLMTLITSTLLFSILSVVALIQSENSFKDVTIMFLFVFLFISPWIFLSLDLFAYYRGFRGDRKK